MTGQILVALKSQDRLGEMIPYLEKIAEPGSKVVFLVSFSPNADLNGSHDNDPSTLKHGEETQVDENLRETNCALGNYRLPQPPEDLCLGAEQKTYLTLEAFRKRGIEMTVDLYNGSLRSVVKKYLRNGNVDLIMKRTGWYLPMGNLLNRMFPSLALSRQQSLAPVLLLHTSAALS